MKWMDMVVAGHRRDCGAKRTTPKMHHVHGALVVMSCGVGSYYTLFLCVVLKYVATSEGSVQKLLIREQLETSYFTVLYRMVSGNLPKVWVTLLVTFVQSMRTSLEVD